MRLKLSLTILLILNTVLTMNAQYSKTHYIAPAPWYYFDQANELIVSTESTTPINVEVKSSNGVLLTTLSVVQGLPIRYRFTNPSCGPACTPAHRANTVYNAEGLIVSSTEKIAVSIRNEESDEINGGNASFIKGNSSLSSYGDQGLGDEFRLGYYRSNYAGLNGIGSLAAPLYSVMAIANDTQVNLNGNALITLNAGQAYCFQTNIGALLTSNKSVVVNSGNWGDAPGGCTDGVFTQVLPTRIAGTNYIIVRGRGTPGTSTNLPEQSTIIATQNNTTVNVVNYNNLGTSIGNSSYTLVNAGDYTTIFHGDGVNIYSSSNVTSTKPVVIYQGVADYCENDMSMPPPLEACTGSNRIEIRKFRSYFNAELPYVGNIILNDPNAIVYVNGVNIETSSGNPRFQIGTTGYYLIRFTNSNVSNQEEIIVNSTAKMSVSIVEQGGGFSMAGFYSSFGETPQQPTITSNSTYCAGVTLTADPGFYPYQWYFNDTIIPGAINQTYLPTSPGNYSVSGTRSCGISRTSASVLVDCLLNVPIDAVNDVNNPPINSQVGAAIQLFPNDTLNNVPLNPNEVIFSIVNNGGIVGASIGSNGILIIPIGTPIGSYTLTYSICQVNNSNNCDTAIVTIEVKDPCDFDDASDSCNVNVYNFVSVDNDSLNEFLFIDGIQKYPSNNVQIFNRWGTLVHETDGYNNIDRIFSGQSEGKLTVNGNSNLPEGTYFYILKYFKPISGIQIEKTGYLYLTY